MARYTDSVCRLCRREGTKLFLKGEKCFSSKWRFPRPTPPGQHGQARQRKASEYGSSSGKSRRPAGLRPDGRPVQVHFNRATGMKASRGNLLAVELRLTTRCSLAGWVSPRQARQFLPRPHHARAKGWTSHPTPPGWGPWSGPRHRRDWAIANREGRRKPCDSKWLNHRRQTSPFPSGPAPGTIVDLTCKKLIVSLLSLQCAFSSTHRPETEGNRMIEIEKRALSAENEPGHTYGRFRHRALERGFGHTWATPCAVCCYSLPGVTEISIDESSARVFHRSRGDEDVTGISSTSRTSLPSSIPTNEDRPGRAGL